MTEEIKELTIKEAAAKFDIAEATVRKYVKDFKLGHSKGNGNKAILDLDAITMLEQIVKLRTNGLSISEIKDLIAKDSLITEETSKEAPEETSEKTAEEASSVAEESEESGEETPKESEEAAEDSDETTEEEADAEESSDAPEEEGKTKRRRQLFNRRYVERQISNDSKRISSLRQRLKHPGLSVQDRLYFEESLERRILFMDGWKHILRWASLK